MKVRLMHPDEDFEADGPRAPECDALSEDLGLDVWAGEVPLRTVRLDPVPAPGLADGTVLPGHIASGPLGPGTVPVRDVR